VPLPALRTAALPILTVQTLSSLFFLVEYQNGVPGRTFRAYARLDVQSPGLVQLVRGWVAGIGVIVPGNPIVEQFACRRGCACGRRLFPRDRICLLHGYVGVTAFRFIWSGIGQRFRY
jgi:hypothetical protein